MLSFSPYAQICEVPPLAALECVLKVMQKWGHISCFRFDNGRPFGDPKRESLTPCALHLIARGCDVLINPPRTPTKNAKVERSQGTTGKWSDAKSCTSLEELRSNLDYAVIAQRERLKTRVCKGLTRAEYYPELFTNPKKYDPEDFDIQRIFQHLTQGKWYRTVHQNGQTDMFGQYYQVGFKYGKQNIIVKLEMVEQIPFWSFYDENFNLLKRLKPINLLDGSYLKIS